MKCCLSCDAAIVGRTWRCPVCGWEPVVVSDVPCFAPEAVGTSHGYSPEWYGRLAALEASNFWFVARNRLLRSMALGTFPGKARYLEIGCGTGFVLSMLRATFPEWTITATELHVEGFAHARSRATGDTTFIQMDAVRMPFRDEFDIVGAFDVIEHIPDDVGALRQVARALRSGGWLLLSVPQHQWLWSVFDDVSQHCRRYSAQGLHSTLREAGFEVVTSTSFTSLLLPAMWASRMRSRGASQQQYDPLAELDVPRWQGAILHAVMGVEFALWKIGLRLPIGGSRVVLARRL
jgi:SAM-dependent methyltransferase